MSEPRDSAGATGAIQYLDAAMVLRATDLVRTGQVIPLSHPLDQPPPNPLSPGRGRLRRYALQHNTRRPTSDGRFLIVNDDAVEFALQGSSHWDALGHFGCLEPDSESVYYGGLGLEETSPDPSAKRLGIDALAGGVVTRGVLLDMVGYIAGPTASCLPDDTRIRLADVQGYLEHHGLALQRGDAVLVYTGFYQRLAANHWEYPKQFAGVDADTLPLWASTKIFALISDNTAVEPVPTGNLDLHVGCIKEQGIYLGELWALEDLTIACRRDGIYEFMLSSCPLNIPGAFGSPCSALAIR
jgi:kynurenine formamidase